MMKVLVTGGAGFIGSHVVDLLIDSGYQVVVVDNLSTGKKEYINEGAKSYFLDIRSKELEQVFQIEKPDFVIHHAAQVDVSISMKNPHADADTNILGSIKLLDLCKKYQVKKFIYASSCAVYGETNDYSIQETHPIQPISFYGASKYTPELYIQLYHQLYGMSYTILRYGNVYGPRQTPKGEGGVVSIFMEKLLSNTSPSIFGDGEQTRDFIYVKDVAAANLLALKSNVNEVMNVALNKKTSINQLYLLISLIVPHNTMPTYLSKRDGDIKYSQLENLKLKKLLNWEPQYNLFEGLEETSEFYKKRKNDGLT